MLLPIQHCPKEITVFSLFYHCQVSFYMRKFWRALEDREGKMQLVTTDFMLGSIAFSLYPSRPSCYTAGRQLHRYILTLDLPKKQNILNQMKLLTTVLNELFNFAHLNHRILRNQFHRRMKRLPIIFVFYFKVWVRFSELDWALCRLNSKQLL